MKKLLTIFIIAFALNLIWENTQAPLYEGYESFWQHFWICLPASLFDAGYTTLLLMIVARIRRQNIQLPVIIITSLIVAAFIELRALSDARWTYTLAMPLVPFTAIGLAPFVQLALLSLVTYGIVLKTEKK